MTKILILAGDTDGNIGDLAIITAVCDHLRSIDPDVRIALVTSRPDRDESLLGIVPLERGWRGFARVLKAARDSDLVICGGGGLFQDDDSLLKMPYWSLRLWFVRLMTKDIVGLSIGAGPLAHPVSRFFGRLALRTLRLVSVRDFLARETLQPLTSKHVHLVPDPAFSLRPRDRDAARMALQQGGVPLDKPLIGVAVRRWFHTDSNLVPHKYAVKLRLHAGRGKREMAVFTEKTAAILNEVIEATGAHVVFLPSYNVAHENDSLVCREIADRLRPRSSSLLCLEDPRLYKAVAGCLSVMLCGRMHPAILAAGQGVPVIGMAYNQKFPGMFALLGQEDRCFSMRDFVNDEEPHSLSVLLKQALRQRDLKRPDVSSLRHVTEDFIAGLLPGAAPAAAGTAAALHRGMGNDDGPSVSPAP